MRTLRRILRLTGLTGLLAAVAGAAPAMADNGGIAACTVSGQILTPRYGSPVALARTHSTQRTERFPEHS
jgi:hypothetical protein